MSEVKLMLGDCLDKLKELDDNSVDSIVTDPPYGLSFMGKAWDKSVPSKDVWEECLRVLKPGGYLLAFAGTRTQHRMAVNIEDAGFEIRDMIAWVYGSGFPKSLNISKDIDRVTGNQRQVIGKQSTQIGDYLKSKEGPGAGGNKPAVKSRYTGNVLGGPATDEAKQWEGWGTALKPALEPITVARKPLSENTVAANVLKHGTGGINIDASRVQYEENDRLLKGGSYGGNRKGSSGESIFGTGGTELSYEGGLPTGRFPANLIHDGSDEVTELFPDSNGGGFPKTIKAGSPIDFRTPESRSSRTNMNDTGSAARFFYCAKTSKKDRNEGLDDFEEKSIGGKGNGIRRYCSQCGVSILESHLCECGVKDWVNPASKKNNHPTVKPTELMKYLVRMVTPKGGTVLDPFMGSGSTGKAAKLEGFDFIGVELDPDYILIAQARIDAAEKETTLEGFFE